MLEDAKILDSIHDEAEIEADRRNQFLYIQRKGQRLKPTTGPPPTTAERTASAPVHEHFIRLPKLDLPKFTGNSLDWQSFWDCFSAAVDNNPSLTGVQKLSYLCSQLGGEATHVITGFQLTNDNYVHSVTLLKERLGQTYKQINAHMQALRDLPVPTNSLSSLRDFHDTIEGHIRSLSTLGKNEPSYGCLLVWSDSQIVLHWIKSQKPLPVFVQHRTAEIQFLLPQANWSYCPTSENPVDLLSRGTTIEVLKSSLLWNHGPTWLTTPSQWPSFQPPSLPPLVLAAAMATEFVPAERPPPSLGIHCIISVDQHSSLNKLLSVSVYVTCFVDNPTAMVTWSIDCGGITKGETQVDEGYTASHILEKINSLQLISEKPKTSRVLLVRQLRLFLAFCVVVDAFIMLQSVK